jgi:hypothetical protein
LLIIGTFEHSIELEQALTLLEANGIARNKILAVPMDTDPQSSIPSMHKSPDLHTKGIEVGIACAAGSSVIGIGVGFILTWGPIFWGLIAAFIGFVIGYGVYHQISKTPHPSLPKKLPEVTIIVQCQKDQSGFVIETMWNHHSLTVGRVPEHFS